MTFRVVVLLLAAQWVRGAVPPAPAIEFQPARKVWLLRTASTSYAMGVNERGELQHLYWRSRLWRADDVAAARGGRDGSSFDPAQSIIPEEFPAWGGPRYVEPAVKLSRADGNRDLVLHFSGQHSTADELIITLQDLRDPIFVDLHYRVFAEHDLIEKHAVLRNETKAPVHVESLQSAVWQVPRGAGYRLSYLNGRWAAETQLVREPVEPGTKVIGSRKGHTSHNFNPWFALDLGTASEEQGEVWFGALGWSGNWRFAIEQTPYDQVRVTGGWNTFDFAYQLAPGATLETPASYAGYTRHGFGEASRVLHRFERERMLPGGTGARLRPVLYNSWEATQFKVDEAGQRLLAQKAAKLGVELFVMDDGWFGKRNNDRAGLGDWTVNPEKFPHGLAPLISYVQSLGMDFGLWVEPEMVNPDSDLYRQHPDWVMHFPGRPESELRNQLVLNLARNDVAEHLFAVLDRLTTEYKIRYLKWDMNRPFAEPGWQDAPDGVQQEIWVEYVRHLYGILAKLRARHPDLEIESCSGGGGRVDLGILRYADEVWTSDNTEAFDRLRIQEGFSQAYAPGIMSAWVTDVPNMNGRSVPLAYRFFVAMQGALGIGADLNKWSEAEAGTAASLIGYYKQIRATVQRGKLYRLLSPRVGEVTANEYVAADGRQAVVFAFLHSQQFNRPLAAIPLAGLDEHATYQVRTWPDGESSTVSGAYLASNGIALALKGDYDSASVLLERTP